MISPIMTNLSVTVAFLVESWDKHHFLIPCQQQRHKLLGADDLSRDHEAEAGYMASHFARKQSRPESSEKYVYSSGNP
jgi:hypothetical protein